MVGQSSEKDIIKDIILAIISMNKEHHVCGPFLARRRPLPMTGLSSSSPRESKHMFEAEFLHGAYGNEECLNYLTSARGMFRLSSMSFAEFMASRRTLSLPSTAENLTSLPFQ